MSRRLKTPSPPLIPCRPTEEARAQRRSRDDFEGGLFASCRLHHACDLLVRHTGGGGADLTREVIIGSLHAPAAGCPFRRRLAQCRIGFSRPIEHSASESVSESRVIGRSHSKPLVCLG